MPFGPDTRRVRQPGPRGQRLAKTSGDAGDNFQASTIWQCSNLPAGDLDSILFRLLSGRTCARQRVGWLVDITMATHRVYTVQAPNKQQSRLSGPDPGLLPLLVRDSAITQSPTTFVNTVDHWLQLFPTSLTSVRPDFNSFINIHYLPTTIT